jgi:hypothetical protein
LHCCHAKGRVTSQPFLVNLKSNHLRTWLCWIDLPETTWTPTGPMGLLSHAPWSGAFQPIRRWWAPVALRYKEKVGASGTRHEDHRRRHPTDSLNTSRSSGSAVAAGRLTHGRHRHRHLVPALLGRDPKPDHLKGYPTRNNGRFIYCSRDAGARWYDNRFPISFLPLSISTCFRSTRLLPIISRDSRSTDVTLVSEA